LQVARNGHFAPSPKEKIDQSRDEVADNSPTYVARDDELASKVKRLLEEGQHAPVALRHYRAGRIGPDEVAEYVSHDLIGSEEAAGQLVPAVRAVLEGFAPAKVVS